jgi:uncharacterized membrane protein YfhO
MGLDLQPGKHTIELFYKPPYFGLSLFVSIAGLLVYFVIIGIKYVFDKKTTNLATPINSL